MPIININTAPLSEQRVDVFAIDGVTYSMPAEVPASLALEVMERYREGGEMAAAPYALESLFGPDGYRALRECQTLRKEDLQAVTKVAMEHVLGQVEEEGKG